MPPARGLVSTPTRLLRRGAAVWTAGKDRSDADAASDGNCCPRAAPVCPDAPTTGGVFSSAREAVRRSLWPSSTALRAAS